MKMIITVDIELIFYHKDRLDELIINKNVSKTYEEGTQEFDTAVKMYEEAVEKKRDEIADFNKKLAQYLQEVLEDRVRGWIDTLHDTFKSVILNDSVGIYEIMGTMIDLSYFCAYKVNKFKGYGKIE